MFFEELLARYPDYEVVGEPGARRVDARRRDPDAARRAPGLNHPVMAATVAELVESRAADDDTGLLFEDRSLDVARGRRRVPAPRRAARASCAAPDPFHVGVLLENVPEYVFLLGGAALAGATVVGINPTRRGAELARDIRHTDCRLVVTSADLRAAARRPRPRDRRRPRSSSSTTPDTAPARRARDRRTRRTALRTARPPDPPGDAVPPDLHVGLDRRAEGRAHDPGPRRARAASARRSAPTTSSTARCRCSTATRSRRTCSRRCSPARRSRCAAGSPRRGSSPTCGATARRSSTPSGARSPTSSRHRRPPHDRDHQLKYVLAPGVVGARHRRVLGALRRARHRGLRLERERGDPHARARHAAGLARPAARGDRRRGRRSGDRRGVRRGASSTTTAGCSTRPTRSARSSAATRPRRSRATTTTPRPTPSARATAGTGPATSAYRDADGFFWFAGRTGDWIRVDGENFAAAPIERILGRAPASRASPSTRCPTRAPATR